ncbi:hypothetical protein [Cohaesibacter intestini]|uniref:hypothetical protein n=1 Tax=Cohaesibacter intestini TaxID=2211145 RepID=UPI000DE8CD78|nr:hypothetical protein [Cohaesibacter intestini]
MQISRYTPKLTADEIERCWMKPLDACNLSAIGDPSKAEIKRFLNNISDRGLIPFVKKGTGKTSPRLYSLKSCLMMRVMRDITAQGATYEFAATVAEKAADVFMEIVKTHDDVFEIDSDDWFLFFTSDWVGHIKTDLIRKDEICPSLLAQTTLWSVLSMGGISFMLINHYPDHWSRDRMDRGLDSSNNDRYAGCDVNGYPLDPAHPWNNEGTPIEIAKRRLEIEEYIAAREQKEGNK